MPWKVSANAWNSNGSSYSLGVVAEADDDPEDILQAVSYWVRNLEPGEKVVIERFHPTDSG